MSHRYGILLREGMILREVKEFDPGASVDATVPFRRVEVDWRRRVGNWVSC